MKKIVLSLLLVGVATMTMAQATKTVKGAVIDLNGNPLPGAKVEATGGAENTVTDADGTFSIEVSQWLKSLSVTYPGMIKKKMSIKGDDRDLIFTMKEQCNYWFVNAIAQYNDGCLGAGAMFGQLKKWGWYGKAVMDFTYIENSIDGGSYYAPTISAGIIKRVSKSFYMYLGGGYTNLYDYYGYGYGYGYNHTNRYSAALLEVGAIHHLKHLSLNYGVGIATDDFDTNVGINFHLGIGYSF